MVVRNAVVERVNLGGGGVTSINTLTGAITLAAGSNITLTPSGNTITISSSGGGGTDFIRLDGTSTTSAIIPFDEGIFLPTDKFAYFGGTSGSPLASMGILSPAGNLFYVLGSSDGADGISLRFRGGDAIAGNGGRVFLQGGKQAGGGSNGYVQVGDLSNPTTSIGQDSLFVTGTTELADDLSIVKNGSILVTINDTSTTKIGVLSNAGELLSLSYTGGAAIEMDGSGGGININTSAAAIISFGTNNITRWNIAATGELNPNASNTYDIGTLLATVRSIYVGTSLNINAATNQIVLDADAATNKGTITMAALSGARTWTLPNTTGNIAVDAKDNAFSVAQTMPSINLTAGTNSIVMDSNGFKTTLTDSGTANRVITFPDGTTTLGGLALTQTWAAQNTYSDMVTINQSTDSAGKLLYVNKGYNNTTATTYGIYADVYVNNSGSGGLSAGYFQAQTAGSGAHTGSVYGINGVAFNTLNGGTVSELTGMNFITYNGGTQTVTLGQGGQVEGRVISSGNMTTYNGINSKFGLSTSSGGVTNLRHYNVTAATRSSGTGVITNQYGLFVPDLTGAFVTNAYGAWFDVGMGIHFRAAGNKIYSSAANTLDYDVVTTHNFRVGGTVVAKIIGNQTYTITNSSTDRAYDASSTSLGEIANVLATFIADIKAGNFPA